MSSDNFCFYLSKHLVIIYSKSKICSQFESLNFLQNSVNYFLFFMVFMVFMVALLENLRSSLLMESQTSDWPPKYHLKRNSKTLILNG